MAGPNQLNTTDTHRKHLMRLGQKQKPCITQTQSPHRPRLTPPHAMPFPTLSASRVSKANGREVGLAQNGKMDDLTKRRQQ